MDARTLAIRLTCAIVAGLLLGANREERGHSAGMRTTLLVCLAGTIAMIQMDLLMGSPDTHNSIVRLDLMRLPLGILSGMGFIGAGAIVRRGSLVHGLTTAATLWIATVLGLCFGGGQIVLGAVGAGLAFGTLWGLKRVEVLLFRRHRGVLVLDLGEHACDEAGLLDRLRRAGFHVDARRFDRRFDERRAHLRLEGHYRGARPSWSIALLEAVSGYEGVLRARWRDED